MTTAPASPDVVSAIYEVADGLRRYETTEDTLTYTFNGVNTTGTLSGPYVPGSLQLDKDGQLLTPGADYAETSPAGGTFDTIEAFASGVLSVAITVGVNETARVLRTPSTAKTSAYTITVYDSSIEADATSGAVSITLPDVADADGLEFNVTKSDSSANGVTIVGTVNGETNPVIDTQYDSYTMKSNGTAWYLI